MKRRCPHNWTLTLALALVPVLSACSANGRGTFLPASSAGDLAPSIAYGAVTIKIPLKIDAKRPDFVSPSTRSALVAIAPAKGCTACTPAFSHDIDLSAASKACVVSTSALTCTITLALKAGTYQGSISTFDGTAGCQKATYPCHALSVDQAFPVKVTSGKVAVPPIALYGVPEVVRYTVIDDATVVAYSSFYGNFGLIGPSAKGRVMLFAADNDGNLILGAGAPSFNAKAGGGFSASVKGNVLLLSAPPEMRRGYWPLTISAAGPGCKVAGAQCALKSTIDFVPIVAVAQKAANRIVMYPGHVISGALFGEVSKGIDKPVAETFDGKGHLFVGNAGNATVTEYAQPYTGAPIATFASGMKNPAALAAAANGDLAVGDTGANNVTVYAPASKSKIATIALPSAPTAIAFDASSNLWVGMVGSLKRYAPPYTGSANLTLNGAHGIGTPVSIGFDVSKGLDVADSTKAAVLAYTSPYTGSPAATFSYPGITSVAVYGYVIAACGTGSIYLLDPLTLSNPVTISISDGAKQYCALDQSAALYETDDKYGQVSEYNYQAFNYFGSVVNHLSPPSAIAAFPFNL